MQFRHAFVATALVGSVFTALPAMAAVTDTTANLNLRGGPATHY